MSEQQNLSEGKRQVDLAIEAFVDQAKELYPNVDEERLRDGVRDCVEEVVSEEENEEGNEEDS